MPVIPLTSTKSTLIKRDLACRRCSYNLKGLKSPGICPECGTHFNAGRRYASNFTDAPLASLHVQARWIGLMVLSGLLTGAAVLTALVLYSMDVDLVKVSWVMLPLTGAWAGFVTMVVWPWAARDD